MVRVVGAGPRGVRREIRAGDQPPDLREVSIRFDRIEELEDALPEEHFLRLRVAARARLTPSPLPWEAAFLAGKCFVRYRRRSGPRRSPLPDFYIGAHAAVAGLTLLTRDATRYRTYFPGLEIIAP